MWKSVVSGALGGLAASWVMNQFQSSLSKAAKELSNGQGDSQESGSGGEDATVKTANAISLGILHRELTGNEKKWAGPAVHYAFGTVVGTIYGALAQSVPITSAGYGTVYGTIVWLAADEIGVPAFGLSKSPVETPASSHMQALASHLVYGIATDLVRRTIVRL
jgi:hypothetical protein